MCLKFIRVNVLCFLLAIVAAYKVSDFKPSILKASPPSGYHSVDTGDNTQGQILCFGDVNGDQYNDYIAWSSNKPVTLLVYFWMEQKSEFNLITWSIEKYKDFIGKIQQIMLTDLNDNGGLQIVVTYSTPRNQTSTQSNYNTIALRVKDCNFQSCSFDQYDLSGAGLANMTAPPSLINLKGSSSSFLVFENTNRYIVIKSSNNNYQKKPFSQFVSSKQLRNTFRKIDKHFSSNVDYNGDCHSDLVILSMTDSGSYILQFYKKQINSNLVLDKQLLIGNNVKFFTFVDFDASGTIDIVFSIGQPGKQLPYIIYNSYSEVTDLCTGFEDFPFNPQNLQEIKIPHQLASGGIFHFGDIDSDSYPDLLTIVTVNDLRRAGLYRNVEKSGVRQFIIPQQLNINQILDTKNTKQVAFFDLGEDGKLDIFLLVQQLKDSDNTPVVTRSCFINNVKDDTLFMKILPLTQTSAYQKGTYQLSNAYGITIQWRITKLDGYKKICTMSQKSQWNYGTLQLPFATSGLGRTNNYVQDLTVGYEGMNQTMSWSPIIPNSKLLVYKKDGQWRLQTLLTNNERVNHVIYVSVGILIILGLVIFLLNYRENQQDKKDQYNFIQIIR